jgi:RNA polymerase sigma factor (sigma-70 family)
MDIREFTSEKYLDMIAWAVHCLEDWASEDAPDVVADVVCRIAEKEIEIDPETAQTYVFGCIKNEAIDVMRMAQRRAVTLRDHAAQIQHNLGYFNKEAERPDTFLEAHTRLVDGVGALSPLISATLELYYIQGLSVEEIAEKQKVDVEAVRKRLTRGRNTLKGVNNE